MSDLSAGKLFSVNGLVAVVTGGGTGIGLMMAQALEANGAAKVYIVGRRLNVLEDAAKTAKHGNIIPIQGDITSKDDLSRIVAQVKSDVGFVNVLIANTGINGPSVTNLKKDPTLEEFQEFFWNPSIDDFSSAFKVNTSGLFYTCIAFLGLLDAGNKTGNVEQKSQIIATSSIAGFNRMVPAGYAYSSSKAAATHLMKILATNLVPFNIRSNIVAPGIYPSEMTAAIRPDTAGKGEPTFPASMIPLQRPGRSEDMAGVILFLVSRAGAYCNGCVVVTDGGRLSVTPATY